MTEVVKRTVTKKSGGRIQTDLQYGVVLNKNSSLTREWVTIHDESLRADIIGTVGINTNYDSGDDYSSGGYFYSMNCEIVAKVDLSAFVVNFLTFNIWGEHVQRLSSTFIEDIGAGVTKPYEAKWEVYSENEVAEHYASIAYIYQVRTKDGLVIKANPQIAIGQAKKFSQKFSIADLEQKKEKR